METIIQDIHSHSELMNWVVKYQNSFLLLYKPESENCNCALKNISEITDIDSSKTKIFKADVSTVKDIHSNYNVDSVPAMLQFRSGKFVNVIKGCMTIDYYESIIKEQQVISKKDGTKQKRVVVYSTNSCVWCTRLKDHLKLNNIRFEDVDVGNNEKKAEEMRRKSGQIGVPQTDIDGHIVVGFDKTKINTLLGIN